MKKPPLPGRKARFKFIAEILAELRKVTWPSRQEAIRLTIMVLIVSVIVGLVLGGLDYGFTELTRLLLPGAR